MVSYGGLPPFAKALKLIVAVTFVGYAAYFFNDTCDLEDDLKNLEMGNPSHAKRPLVSGTISRDLLMRFAVLSAVLGLFTAFTLNLQVFLVQTIFLIFGVLYSLEPIRFKKRFFLKQFVTATGHALSVLSGALAIGIVSPPVLFLMAINFAISIGVNPLMDLRDLRGDRAMGVTTIPIVFGPTFTIRFAIATFLSIAAASAIGYAQLGFSIAMPILAAIVLTALIFTVYPMMRKWDEPGYMNQVIFNRFVPLFLLLQLVPILGVLGF
jgi:4-hydroxybenzoate polyprenyltransferase